MSKVLKIGDVCNINTGSLDSNAFVKNGQYPFFTCAKDPLTIDSFSFDDDVVLIAGNNAQGNFHINRHKGKFDAYQRTYVLTSKDDKSIDFIYYLLKLALKLLKDKSQGSQTKFLTIGIIKDIIIPNLNNSNKVAKVLSDFDAKIELNNKINQELEAMATTLYNYWFVQFDFPNEQGTPYKSSGSKMVYNAELKREIPENWEVKKISSLMPVVTGKKDANFATASGKYNFFTCGEEILKCDTFEFEGKSVLVAGNGNFTIKLYEGKFNAYQRTYVLIPNNEKHYTIVYMAVRDRIASLTKGSRGSIIKFITKGDLEDIHIPLPKDENLDVFSQLNTITKKIEINLKENQKLIVLRDWLLPMLMNKQVTVQEAKKRISMAAEPNVAYKEKVNV